MKTKIKFTGIILSLFIIFTFLLNYFCLSMQATFVSANEVDNNYYFTDYDTSTESYNAGDKLNKKIMSEGITLLKNENSLPLSQGAKVSVFGMRSVNLLYGGAGSGSGSGGTKLSIQDSLTRAGIEVNTALTTFYKAQPGGSGLNTYGVFAGPKASGIGETPILNFTSTVEATYNNYNDAGLIVFSRASAEAGDAPKGMSTGYGSDGYLNGTAVTGARNYDDHYLQLDQYETDLINYVCDRFSNVIIVLNTGSQMEVGFLDDINHYAYREEIKGALWIGYPGVGNGFEAFGEIISGKTNPSGRTVDTYSRDFKKDPTWSNMPTYTNNLFNYTNLSRSFVNYTEGIYSGYRYYETRSYTEGDAPCTATINGSTTTSWENWYNSQVVYPFGYGLSYTTFNWEIVSSNIKEDSALTANDTISITVKVTNKGSYAGKDVVELYYTPPYKANGIEKAQYNLGAYQKTKLLKPNESQELLFSIKVSDMASYDYSDANKNDFKGYELDEGNYTISLSKNSHQHILSKTYKIENEGIKIENSVTGYKVENRFDDVSSQNDIYLSRNDWEGTWPTEPTDEQRVASQNLINLVNNTSVNDKIVASDDASDPYYCADMPVTGQNNNVKLQDLYGLQYSDPLWDSFLNQLIVGDKSTANSMAKTIWQGGWTLFGIDNVGMPTTQHEDGPSGIAGRYVSGSFSNFACETVTASTWNIDIAYEKGLILGNQALLNGVKYVNGLYAPAVNIHRSAFGGRNFEYFSEDPYLSGIMAGNIIKGCNEKGLVTFLKHFAVNDQESKRDSLLTWANEQTMREIYFKPFQICVETYKSHGIMSALNSVGGIWTGGSYNLLTEVLRNEWGFEGMIISDYLQGRGQLNGNQALRGGGDFLLCTSGSVQNPVGLDKPTTVANLKRAMHNICYTIVNYTAIFNSTTLPILTEYSDAILSPAVSEMDYNGSVATVKLNSGKPSSNITYTLKEGSSLPDGLILNTDGSITGKASLQKDVQTFTIIASYGKAVREATFSLPVVDKEKSVIYLAQESIVSTYVGKPFQQNIDWAYIMDNTTKAITYSLAGDSILPPGVTLSSDGVLSGTPLAVCDDYEFTVTASADEMYSMSVNLKISTYYSEIKQNESNVLASAKFSEFYACNLGVANNSNLNYALKDGSSLPDGLSLTAQGNIVGSPTETALNHSFTVVVSGNHFKTSEIVFSFSVALAYDLKTIDTASLNQEYTAYLNVAQGASDISYEVKEGKLPDGLELSADGVVSGTPTEQGEFNFVVKANSATAESSEVELLLKVENNNSNVFYYTGLAVGISGVVVSIVLAVIYLFVIDKKNYIKNSTENEENKEKVDDNEKINDGENVESSNIENNKNGKRINKHKLPFISGFTGVISLMLCCVIIVSIVTSPTFSSSTSNTLTFEAEYTYLDEFMGAGISNSAEGVNNIYGDGQQSDIEKGWSNGYFVGNTYAVNSITFEITSSKTDSGKLILRLASELGNLTLNNQVFGVIVNGKELEYSISVANSASGTYQFVDYPISQSISLNEGENTITLTIKDNTLKDGNSIGAPLIDCIKITTQAELTWEPLTDNPERRGQI